VSLLPKQAYFIRGNQISKSRRGTWYWRTNEAAKDFDAVAGIEVDGRRRTIGIEYERNPKAAARYHAIREVFERDETTDAVLYLTANDDILYLLAMELRAMRKRIGFVLSDAFRRSLLEIRTLTNSNKSEVVLLRDFLCGNKT
jgi:hypothetical protein